MNEAIQKLENILRYLQQQANDTPRPGDRLFAVTDAALAVVARRNELILEQTLCPYCKQRPIDAAGRSCTECDDMLCNCN